MSKKILICGATGFIGKNLVNYFETLEEYEVYAVGFKRKLNNFPADRFFQVDLTDKKQVKNVFSSQKFDVVVQAAANTSGSKDIVERPYLHVTDNAVMNALILQACYYYNVSIFYLQVVG